MNIISAITMGFSTLSFLNRLKKVSPELVESLDSGKALLKQVVTSFEDKKLTKVEQTAIANGVAVFAKELADIVKALPTYDG